MANVKCRSDNVRNYGKGAVDFSPQVKGLIDHKTFILSKKALKSIALFMASRACNAAYIAHMIKVL